MFGSNFRKYEIILLGTSLLKFCENAEDYSKTKINSLILTQIRQG